MERSSVVGPPATVIADKLTEASSWWNDINESPVWQDRIFHLLAALYGVVAAVALVQLVRIQLRVPEYGWTTQKVFHFLNFVVNGVRAFVFGFRRDVQKLNPEIVQHVLLDMPSLVFFTTYVLLVLFWAEIYYQARAISTDGLRPSFLTINAVVYVIQIALWFISWWKPIRVVIIISKMFFAGFLHYKRMKIIFNSVAHPGVLLNTYFGRGVLVCGTWVSAIWWKTLLDVTTLPCFGKAGSTPWLKLVYLVVLGWGETDVKEEEEEEEEKNIDG